MCFYPMIRSHVILDIFNRVFQDTRVIDMSTFVFLHKLKMDLNFN